MQKKTDKVRFPLIRWGITEGKALEICYRHGFDWGGLYENFKRVSCFCCPLQGIKALKILFQRYPKLWERMLKMDRSISTNRGFRDYETVEDLNRRFIKEIVKNLLLKIQGI